MKTTIIALIIVLVGVGVAFYIKKNEQNIAYKMDVECARLALEFPEKSNGLDENWQILQSKFVGDKNTCFAEYKVAGDILYIFDITHNTQLAVYPAFAGQLYPGVPGGEMSPERIALIENYRKQFFEIFGQSKE